MMDDRTLLEKAAKAAGMSIRFNSLGLPDARDDWNPLADDGDALRLVVKLRIDLHYETQHVMGEAIKIVEASFRIDGRSHHCATETARDGVEAATRRAIVRAAAAQTEQGGV